MKKKGIFPLCIGLALLAVFLLAAIAPGVLTPYGPKELFARWLPSGGAHLLGTNAMGYDIFTELVYGARQTLLAGVLSSILALALGALIGILSTFRGWLGGAFNALIQIFILLPKLIALIVLPVTGVLTSRIVKRSQRYFVAQQKNLGAINGKIEETYAGHNVVCAFNREAATQKEFDAINARLYRSAWKSQFLSGLMMPVTTFVSKLGYVCVVVLGGSLAARGTITIGDIQAFLNYMANFTQPITQLAQISTQLQTMAAAAERVFDFLAEAEEPADPALPAPAEHIRGDVSFRHVRFGYDPEQPVIRDWSCDVPAGKTVAIVGPTGAGKTTIFNLLTGVYKPDTGTILLDGQNLTGKSTTDINKAGIARTFQNIRLFKDLSVLDNVKAGLHNPHTYSTIEGILRLPRYYKVEKEMDEEAMELLKVFGLDNECDFKASNLPYGKQRKLEIARALATEPKLLLLDEPAAGMNPNETAELMETIRFVRDHFGMTILLIEHDMKLVSGICERLTVLNFGQVLCTGPTQEVLSNPDVIKAYLGDE